MKTFLKNYKQTLILLAAIIIGAIAGLILGEKATVLSPLGDLFINLMFIIIVPLVFLTISTSISKITQPKRVGKILGTIVLVFVITSLVSVLIGLAFGTPLSVNFLTTRTVPSAKNIRIILQNFFNIYIIALYP